MSRRMLTFRKLDMQRMGFTAAAIPIAKITLVEPVTDTGTAYPWSEVNAKITVGKDDVYYAAETVDQLVEKIEQE